MNKRNVKTRLFTIIALLAMVASYLWFYLFPTLEKINKNRREGKDLEVKIEDKRLERVNFSFGGEREALIIDNIGKELQQRLPKTRGKADWARVLDRTNSYLSRLAQSHKIDNLKTSEPTLPASLSQGGLKYRLINMTFTAAPGQGLNFINHLPWWKFHMVPQAISVTPGTHAPQFRLGLRIYYITGKKPVPPPQMQGTSIDFDSEMLLESVYESTPFRFSKRELPTQVGTGFPIKRSQK